MNSQDIAEVVELKANTPTTPCPDWCEMADHAVTRSGHWHEGAISRIPVASGDSGLYCEVTEGGDWSGVTWDLRLSISAEAGKITPDEARQFAAGLLRAADLYDRLTSKSVSPTL